jgi:hypothetical protein
MDELIQTRANLTGTGRWRPVQGPVWNEVLRCIVPPERSIAVTGVLPTILSSRVRCAGDALHDECGERRLQSPAGFTPFHLSLFEATKTNARFETSTVATSPDAHHRHVSHPRMNPGTARLASASNNNTLTTTSLPFDNSLNWCHCSNRRGGLDGTMSNSTVAKRCDGRVPRAGILRGSNSPSRLAFAKMLAPHQLFPLDSQALIRRASVSNKSTSEAVGDVQPLNRRAFLFNKVLRFWLKGQRSSPQLVRISSGLLVGSSLAVRGDALIHGPTLVARPVGSEWRTRHPYQTNIQTNYEIGDQK